MRLGICADLLVAGGTRRPSGYCRATGALRSGLFFDAMAIQPRRTVTRSSRNRSANSKLGGNVNLLATAALGLHGVVRVGSDLRRTAMVLDSAAAQSTYVALNLSYLIYTMNREPAFAVRNAGFETELFVVIAAVLLTK